MMSQLLIADHERRLIPEGRVNGPMPWMIAIMVLLTVLAGAMGLALDAGARSVASSLERKATVQIVEPRESLRIEQKAALIEKLRAMPAIVRVDPVTDSEARMLLEPWIGKGGITSEIPVPALIDIEFASPPTAAALDRMRAQLRDIAPAARIDSQAQLVDPVSSLMRWLVWLAVGLVLLLLVATAATVVLAARSALNSHRGTIDTVHLLGATDREIARLFQRRIMLDAAFGGTVGFLVGLIVVLGLGGQLSRVRSALFDAASLPWYAWPVLLLVPLLVVLIANLAARQTVLGAIRKSL